MSRGSLSNEVAADADADARYRNMAALSDQGGGAGVEQAANTIFDSLRTAADPILPTDVVHGIRTLRARTFRALGTMIETAGDDRAADIYRLAERGLRDTLVLQAQAAIATQNAGAGLAWTRNLGNRLGSGVRNLVLLVRGGGATAVVTGSGSYEDRLIEQEVERQIDLRFAGLTFDQMAPEDQALIRQQVGRLAPNFIAFDPRNLMQWAANEPSTVIDATTGNSLSYYRLVEVLVGGDYIGSKHTLPVLSLMQKDPAYRARLEEIYNERAAEQPVQLAYNRVRRERSDQDTQKTRIETMIQQIEGALQSMSQIREQQSIYISNRDDAAAKTAEKTALGPVTAANNQARKELEASERAYKQAANTASSNLTRLVGDVKGKYRRLLLAASPSGTAFPSILKMAAGTLSKPTGPDNFVNTFQKLLDVNGSNLGIQPVPTGAATPGLRDQLDQVKDAIEMRNEPYSPTNQPDLYAEGYKDFDDLKRKNDTASSARSTDYVLTPHQLTYNVIYRQLRVQIPPQANPPNNAHRLAVENAQKQAIMETFLLMDRVESDMDEGSTVREARRLSANRIMRLMDSGKRLSFKEFVEDNLAEQDLYKGLKGLTLKTTANEVLQMIREERLKEEHLPELMRQIELLGQDQLEGSGKLNLEEDIRPLHRQLQLAWYRLRAESMLKEAGKTGLTNREEVILNMLKEKAPEAIPPDAQPGMAPLAVATRRESRRRRFFDAIKAKIQELGPDSDDGKLQTRRLGILQQIPSLVLGDMVYNVVANIPDWWRRRRKRKEAAAAASTAPATEETTSETTTVTQVEAEPGEDTEESNVVSLNQEKKKKKKKGPRPPSPSGDAPEALAA